MCDGVFAFRTKLEAEACCRLTRSLTDNTFAPTVAPTPLGTENLRDDSGGSDAGTTVSCRNLGGPSDTSVRVRYYEFTSEGTIDQLGDGPTISGDECGAPTPSLASDNESTSGAEAVMSAGRWYIAAFALALTAAIMR